MERGRGEGGEPLGIEGLSGLIRERAHIGYNLTEQSQQNAETTSPRNSGIEWHEQMKNKDVDHWSQNRRLSSSYLLFLQSG